MVLRTDRWLRTLAWIALSLPTAPCLAASLQVSPTQFELRPQQNAEALWISNSGTQTVQVQVRVFQWQQVDGRDTLTPTQALLPSPPDAGPGGRTAPAGAAGTGGGRCARHAAGIPGDRR